ncbi:HAMP domain-containing sensor histidine kinase [Pectobacterium brasiliense]|uniref:sensor histidine kinase n=1 Tax=Pectobacterium brasiliense TaxID=180957 RepID=UPI002A8351D7|nr:HAMP domain-containing sensor histidine kinase [Pectobacterium brasiliense]MDY4368293.1 HAMP domain-containing sensor histidine kinase [Pectobacterium brasiliense]MDY7057815.1 HAMP domain-containing sensor histidine kinase [Pectobacterium brasiliense]
MKLFKPRSLRWRLTSLIIGAQIVLIVILNLAQLVVEATLWHKGDIYYGTDSYAAVNAVADSVARDSAGKLIIQTSPELHNYLDNDKKFWFVVRDSTGQQITYGSPPKNIDSAMSALDAIAYADLGQDIRKSEAPLGTVQWAQSQAGEIKVMTTTQIPVTFLEALQIVSVKNLVVVGFLSLVIIVVVLITTPWVVKRTLAGINRASEDAAAIDYNRRGMHLSKQDVPTEILPFIDTVNGAFGRLDEGYESHKRFLANAAHELRTPIAILNTRLSSLPSGALKTRLLADTTRLTVLSGQLLDLHRFENSSASFETINVVEVLEHLVGDIAPLAVSAGYEIALETEVAQAWVKADRLAVERALTNLIQNAISYGGQRGTISVRIGIEGHIDVLDEGDGIPEAERERIFEPFHRLKNDGRGAGLGLDLVQKIMAMHHGYAELLPAVWSRGAHFRLNFRDVKIVLKNSHS